jgi:TRAP-type uncharacterized transport system substrate-binding protein
MPLPRIATLGRSRAVLPGLISLAALACVLLLAPGLPRAAGDALSIWWSGGAGLRLALPLADQESKALAGALNGLIGEGASVEEVPVAGPRAALEQLLRGEADVALVPGVSMGDGGEAMASLRVIAEAGTRLVHILTPADSPLRSFDMLAGTRIGVGQGGSAEESLARLLVSSVTLDPAPKLVAGHNADLEQAFLDGEIDAALVLRAPASPDVAALIATGYYRLLSLPANSATVWSLPGAFATSIPAQTYASPSVPELGSGTPTLGLPVYLVARGGLPGALARRVNGALQEALTRAGAAVGTGAQLAGLPAGWRVHPAAARQHRGRAPVTGEDVNGLATLGIGIAVLALLAWGVSGYRGAARRGQREALLYDLLRRSRALEATLVTESNAGLLADARKQLAAIDDEAEAAWLCGRLDASEVLLLRLGWGAELPERTAEEIRARAEAMVSMPEVARPTGRPSFVERAAAAAAMRRDKPGKEAPAPAAVDAPAPPKVTVRAATRVSPDEEDFRPSPPPPRTTRWDEETEEFVDTPRPAPAPAPKVERPREMVGFEADDAAMEESLRSSRFTAYTPIDTFAGNDEFGSGALLDTIRVRRSSDFDDEPAARPAPREPETLPWRTEHHAPKADVDAAPPRPAPPAPAPAPAPTPAPVPVPVPAARQEAAKPVAPAPEVRAEPRPAPAPVAATPAAAPATAKPGAAPKAGRVDPRPPAAKQAAAPKDKGPRNAKQRGKVEKPVAEVPAKDDAPPVDVPQQVAAPESAGEDAPSKPQLPLF